MADNMATVLQKRSDIPAPFDAEDTAPYIFISYAHADSELVYPIITRMYEAGYRVWYDEGIEINSDYNDVIATHIKESALFLMFVSRRACESKYVMGNELHYANRVKEDEQMRLCFLERDVKLPAGADMVLGGVDNPKYACVGADTILEDLLAAGFEPDAGKRKAMGLTKTPETGEVSERSEEDEYVFDHISGGVCLTKYNGSAENVVVPAMYKGQRVLELRGTFSKNETVRSVVIPHGVRSIGDSAFDGCSSLKEVTIPDSVTSIGEWVFSFCTSLVEVTIPDSVISIGYGAFAYCGSLTIACAENSTAHKYANEENIPVRLVEFSASPARNKKNIPFISDAETPYVYCSYAHEDAEKVFPIMEKLHDMGYSIRYDELDRDPYECAGEIESCAYFLAFITPAYISSAINQLRRSSKQRRILYWLERCNLPDDLEIQHVSSHDLRSWVRTPEDILDTIANMLDKGNCRGHYSPPIPGFEYFATDEGITLTNYTGEGGNVVIEPEYHNKPVVAIGESAFYGCSSLTSVTISNGLTSIGGWAFSYCSSLTAVTIPDSVTSIGKEAFFYCFSLTTVTIPDSVTNIGAGAFYDCSSLTTVTIPDSVTSIGDRALYGCSSLTEVTIPDSVTSVGDFAFAGCGSLREVTIPDSVTSIGESAFDGCHKLISIDVSSGNRVYKSIDGVLYTYDEKELIAYPGGRSGSFEIPDSVTSIGVGAFSGCSSLKEVTIPDSVTSIGEWAFSFCTSLVEVTIPDSVTSIGERALYGCSSLQKVTISDSVTNIGAGAFDDCPRLTVICSEGSYAQQYCEENKIRNRRPARKSRWWVVPAVILLLAAAAAAVQLTGLCDILGLLDGLLENLLG